MVNEFSKRNVGKVVLQKWCLNGTGYPIDGFFMDHGSEFLGGHIKALCKKVGARIQLTPSYSPGSNDSCERRHGVIELAMKKIIADQTI